MFIIRNTTLFLAIGAALVALSLGALALFGLRPSIEFVGGSLIEIGYQGELPAREPIDAALSELSIETYSLRSLGDDAYVLRTTERTPEETQEIVAAFAVDGYTPELRRHTTIGPVIGKELQNKAIMALGVVLLLTILYVAFAFRHVSKPVSSWKYGFIAIVALIHDIAIPVGVFATTAHFYGGAELDVLFVTALLTILGYSVNDTIVIFDRIRENLKDNVEKNVIEPFKETVGRSLEQTFVRSFNTSLTVLVVVVAILLFGGSATRFFALALTAGVVAGTYSSLFVAAPLLVLFEPKRAPGAEGDEPTHVSKEKKA